jgi:hypothetical protein
MDKATLLTASKVELGASGNPRSDIIRLLGPALEIALHFQSFISSVSLFLCLRACSIANLTCTHILIATKILVLKAFVATKFGAFHAIIMSSNAIVSLWNSRNIQALRKKLFYEFAVFVLGGGNILFVLLFWPGWWLIAAASWGLWTLCS